MLNQCRNDFYRISYDSIICVFKNWCRRIPVNCNNTLRLLYTYHVLKGSGNTTGNVQLRLNDLARLPNQALLICPLGIDYNAGRPDCCAEELRKFTNQIKILGASHATAARNNHIRVRNEQL